MRKGVKKFKEVECTFCKKKFNKESCEIKRSENKTGTHFCSRTCVGKYAAHKKYGNTMGFGFYVSSAKKRSNRKNMEFNLTPEYLKWIFFDIQKGKCNISGLNLILNKGSKKLKDKNLFYASLDRIDNSKGYTKDNVHFICLGINYMRNTCSLEDTINFIKELKKQ